VAINNNTAAVPSPAYINRTDDCVRLRTRTSSERDVALRARALAEGRRQIIAAVMHVYYLLASHVYVYVRTYGVMHTRTPARVTGKKFLCF
jgi:hypothetical protein